MKIYLLSNLYKELNIFQVRFILFSIDGGVANNDFVVQLISTLTNKKIERRNDVESAALGVAFLAGLHSGMHSLLFKRC
jgi:glycerol kinase